MSQLLNPEKLKSSRSLKPHSNPSLKQTRRHSWFGTTQEAEVEPNGIIKKSDIYDIQEETPNEEKKQYNNVEWWNETTTTLQTNSVSLNNEKKGQENGMKPGSKNVTIFQNGIEKGSMEGEKMQRSVGLQPQPSNTKNTPAQNNTTDKPSLPKRRSGLGSISGNMISFNRKLSPSADNNCTRESAEEPVLAKLMKQTSASSDSRFSHRRATVHYSSTGRPSLMDTRRSTIQPGLRADESRALEQIKDVCRDYLVYRLRQRNLANRVVIDRKQPKNRWLSQEIVYINNELEKLQKCRFTDISKQIGITLRSEDVLRKVFFELSSEIITTEQKPQNTANGVNRGSGTSTRRCGGVSWMLKSSGSRWTEITWGRIFAVLAVAGGLAVDCVQQGHADLVNCLIEYMGEFAIDEGVLSWIVQQGGWEAVRDLTYESSSPVANLDTCYFNKITSISLAFVTCTVGAVLGAIAFGGSSNVEDN